MSFRTVQQIVVRMLFDPVFADAVYADSAVTLADERLTDDQRQWLTAPDRRAYGTDPLRRTRALHALIEEFPVATAVGVEILGGITHLDDFFSSARFHDGVRLGHHLVADFATWLRDIAQTTDHPWSKSLAATATLEEAMTKVRRTQLPPLGPGLPGVLRLTPLATLVDVHCGTLALVHNVRDRLGPTGAAVKTLVEHRVNLDSVPRVYPEDTQHVLVMRAGPETGDISLEELSPELAVLLRIAETPTRAETLAQTVIEMGASPQDALEILDGFLQDQLLLPCTTQDSVTDSDPNP